MTNTRIPTAELAARRSDGAAVRSGGEGTATTARVTWWHGGGPDREAAGHPIANMPSWATSAGQLGSMRNGREGHVLLESWRARELILE